MSEHQDVASLVGDLHLSAGLTVHVDLPGSRSHQVQIAQHHDTYELVGMVADATSLTRAGLDPFELWRRNSARRLTGLHVDDIGSAWVRARVPLAGITPEEFQLVVLEVAREADRLEYVLSGAEDRF